MGSFHKLRTRIKFRHKQRARMKYAYEIMFLANEKEYVDALSEDQRKWLIDQVKGSAIDNCMCCPCFAWKFAEDKSISGCICTIGGEPNVEEKGQCNV